MSDRYEIIYSSKALGDLDSIYSYITYNLLSNLTAQNYIKRIHTEILSLDIFPERYAKVDLKPWDSAEVHKLPVGKFIVFYMVDNKKMQVTVLRIIYGGRDIENIIGSDK